MFRAGPLRRAYCFYSLILPSLVLTFASSARLVMNTHRGNSQRGKERNAIILYAFQDMTV